MGAVNFAGLEINQPTVRSKAQYKAIQPQSDPIRSCIIQNWSDDAEAQAVNPNSPWVGVGVKACTTNAYQKAFECLSYGFKSNNHANAEVDQIHVHYKCQQNYRLKNMQYIL